MNLSKSFTLREAVFSDTAFRVSIDNNTSEKLVLDSMSYHARTVLEPLVEQFGKFSPISWYRCEELEYLVCNKAFERWCFNRRIQVSREAWLQYLETKSHPKGEATDIWIPTVKSLDIYNFIESNLVFDQLILDCAGPEFEGWVHVSSVDEATGKMNRKQAFKVLR